MKDLFCIRRLPALLLCLALFLSYKAHDDEEVAPPASNVSNKGLTVSPNGDLLLNGTPFHGIGVNYFSAFSRTLQPESLQDTSYRAGFRYLKKRKIPFVRFMACGFWPANWNLYLHNKTQYFKNFDAVVQSAEELEIGLIPSLFWHHSSVPDLMGESVNQWGNPNSKTIRFMREYVKEVVSRYKDSPAIWGWELGNEYNLVADLPGENEHLPQITVENGTPAVRTKADKLRTDDIRVAMIEFAKTVRLYDASRIIISGNANPRPAAYHLYTAKNWTRDTEAQYNLMLDTQNPDPINTYSIHHYPDNEFQYFADQKASLKEIIRVTMAHASQQKKPLFIGEFGAAEAKLGVDNARQKYFEILEGIEEAKVPLAAVWVFDYSPHNTEEAINIGPDNGSHEYMLQAISELNERITPKSSF